MVEKSYDSRMGCTTNAGYVALLEQRTRSIVRIKAITTFKKHLEIAAGWQIKQVIKKLKIVYLSYERQQLTV